MKAVGKQSHPQSHREGTGQITLTARATSYFTEEVGLKEYTKSVKGDGKITTTEGLESEEEEDL